MRYAYFPGCSQDATSRQYGESVEAVSKVLDMNLVEIDDWNCCGSTSYMNVNEILSFCLTARNLAQAAKTGDDVVTPCNACFTNMLKADTYMATFPDIKTKVNKALAEAGMKYEGGTKVKHLLQAIIEDVGLERVKSFIKRPLNGLRIAPYYGCQIVRPFCIEDDKNNPVMMDHLLEALGATPTHFPMKTTCCGGSLIGTREEVALRLCRNLLLCAEQSKADCIAVACPLCQMNLDVYQNRINRIYGTHFNLPVIYFTQLMGLAFGLDNASIGLNRCVVPATQIMSRFAGSGL